MLLDEVVCWDLIIPSLIVASSMKLPSSKSFKDFLYKDAVIFNLSAPGDA